MIAVNAVANLSYQRTRLDFGTIFPTDATQLLSQIEKLLSTASQEFVQRRYQEAIAAYQQAEQLIYAHLDSGYRPGSAVPIRDAKLFLPLVESSLGWMNIAPVPGPVSPVRPISPVPDAGPLYHQVGLRTMAISTPVDDRAAADLFQASILTQQGNSAAANVLVARAEQTSKDVATRLQPVLIGPSAGMTAITAPAPAEAPANTSMVRRILTRVGIGGGATVAAAPIDRATVVRESSLSFTTIPAQLTAQRTIGLLSGNGTNARVQTISWSAGAIPDAVAVINAIYA